MENRYDKYKDSGIAWIGEIPEHWNIVQLKRCSEFINGYAFNSNYFNKNTGIPVIRIGDICNEKISFENIVYVQEDKDLDKFIVQKNDILIAMSGATVGKIGIYEDENIAYINQRVGIIRAHQYDFIKRMFFTKGFTDYISLSSAGSAQPNISSDEILNFYIPFPLKKEQQTIAAYLDQKCGEIDELITLQEEMITKLQSYKQSVITEAVTKGLDKNVLLKDSGIKWIGEIPKHWEASKTLFVLSMSITDGPHTTPELFETGIPFVSAEAVSFGNGRIDFSHIRGYISEIFYQECCKKYIPQIDDIYMIKSGATTGRVAIVDADIKFTIWSPLAVFRCNKERMLPRFLFYQLQSNGYQKQIELNWSYGTQQNIGMRTLEKLILSVPPLPEQYSIADYLDKKCSEIDELISIKQQKIEKLKEYKKSLIFECVTGKRKVS